MRRPFTLSFFILFVALSFILYFQNSGTIEVRFLFWNFSFTYLSLSLSLLLLGALSVSLIWLPLFVHKRNEAGKLQNQLLHILKERSQEHSESESSDNQPS